MNTNKYGAIWVLLGLLFLIPQKQLQADEPVLLEVYDSPYNHLIILQKGDLIFFRRMENGATVSAIDLANPARQVIPYTGTLFAATFFKPNPKQVLSVGMGAGAINRLFTKIYPLSQLVTVEIDPMVVKAAEKYTGFRKSQSDDVVIRDGRVFLRKVSKQWDWIILDAFVRRSQIPPHLTTLEFYKLVAQRLVDDGVMVSNLLSSGTKLFDSHVVTLREAFPQVLFFRVPKRSNIIALCVKYSHPDLRSVLKEIDPQSMPALSAYGIDFSEMKEALIPHQDPRINRPGEILIDDFAPVEFLELQGTTKE